MRPTVTFWFDLASTYSYLSAMRIEAEAETRGIAVSWKPFLLGPIFAAQGWSNSPFNLYPAKGRYMLRDMERRCAALGLPLQWPSTPLPANSIRAARLAIAALETTDKGSDLCRMIYHMQFGEGADIADADTLQEALHRVGLSDDLHQVARSPELKPLLRANTDQAQAAGIFGAPSFTIGDELFWGDDHLEAAFDWAVAKQD
ncbi:MAG: 2-hydroxychromene-2-carboxylate isomerase [Alphaproteobacteria bacterium]